jgi:NAD(P)-dependent dehydrogenase (short-subunit alcohol dehydrogenase family)
MKTIVITGANTGLGYECARRLLEEDGWGVVLACRNPDLASQAVRKLKAASGRACVQSLPLNLASLASVRELAASLSASCGSSLRALVCNAAVQAVSGKRFTEDGFELTFGVNHLGHFLLTQLLLPQMARGSQIMIVSSGTHDPTRWTGMPRPHYTNARALARGDWESQEADAVAGRRAYTTSKLCNLLFAYELARRLPMQRQISVNAFDPGLMPGSGLARDYGPLQRFAWKFVLPALSLAVPGVNTRRRSGRNLGELVLAIDRTPATGQYYQKREATASSAESHDQDKAVDLWAASEDLIREAGKGRS